MRRLAADKGTFGSCLFVVISAALLVSGCGGSSDDSAHDTLLVGVAQRDITPDPVTAPPTGQVWLGGYGFGPERRSSGVLARIHVRAFVVSDQSRTVAFAENETQGAFPAYKRGPFGLTDIGAAVEAATAGQIPRQHVVVSSDHSHAGPDTTGVWGGLPNAYMGFLRDQTVGAITDAFAARQPARLLTGTADATALLHSQFAEPPNDRVDGDLRVLVAADPESFTLRAILINFAAHATVMGAGNLLISADWPGVVATRVEQATGVQTAVVMVGAVGRTQPDRPDVPDATDPEKLDAYANRVSTRVTEAISKLRPVNGTRVDAAQLFLRETYSNSFFDLSLLGSAIARSNRPPWLDGSTVGTLVSAVRIGDLFVAAVPGEAYPAIQFGLQEQIAAQQHFIFGLANDQLGYLIAPQEGYAQVAAAAPDNDNAMFNISPAIGDHVMCTLFKAARQIGFALMPDPDKCAPYAAEDNRLPSV